MKTKLGLDRRGHSPLHASKAELDELGPGLYSGIFQLDLRPLVADLEEGQKEVRGVELQIVGDFVGGGKTSSLTRPLVIEFQPALPAIDYPDWIRFSEGAAGEAEIQTRRPVISPLASGWYAGDLHLHTSFRWYSA